MAIYRTFLADDDSVALKIMSKQTEHLDSQVELFANGRDLWLALESNATPCLILLDWHMPGISGLQVCRLVKERISQYFSYVILITGQDGEEQEMLSQAFEAGVDDFISKPIRPMVLKSHLRAADRLIKHELELEVERRYFELHASSMEKLASERARKLIEADRMVTLGTLSAGIAHEINNSASFISGNTQTLRKFWPTIAENLESAKHSSNQADSKLDFILTETVPLLDGIMAGIARISKIVKGLRVYTHAHESIEYGECDLTETIEHSLEIVRAEIRKNVTTILELDQELPTIQADKMQLEQVIVNLIINAAHAMEKAPRKELTIRTSKDEAQVRIEIEDSGSGIPEKNLEKIWIPFFTTKEVGKGTGLGLHICKDIIQQHAGRLTVENVAGSGAKFSIVLPLKPGQ